MDKLNKLDNNKKDKNSEFLTFKYKRKINFLSYIFFKLTFEKKNRYFKVYEKLRMKILSEQHLLRNHLIYYPIKINKKK